MYIERGKQFLDAIVEVIKNEFGEKKINIPVFAQHFLTASDLGATPYISVILDHIEPDISTIGRGIQMMNIYYAITLVEKYQEDKLFIDLPIIEDALGKIEAKLPEFTSGIAISAINVAYEEVGNIVLQASEITFIVSTDTYS
ncbi:MAG: hypothetical protein GPJ50_03405 [Candidatus Heimdallarchaeota archaeon]|nr:hypothetical protein [Candidatus Heimdallarchaeota archaeon]